MEETKNTNQRKKIKKDLSRKAQKIRKNKEAKTIISVKFLLDIGCPRERKLQTNFNERTYKLSNLPSIVLIFNHKNHFNKPRKRNGTSTNRGSYSFRKLEVPPKVAKFFLPLSLCTRCSPAYDSLSRLILTYYSIILIRTRTLTPQPRKHFTGRKDFPICPKSKTPIFSFLLFPALLSFSFFFDFFFFVLDFSSPFSLISSLFFASFFAMLRLDPGRNSTGLQLKK